MDVVLTLPALVMPVMSELHDVLLMPGSADKFRGSWDLVKKAFNAFKQIAGNVSTAELLNLRNTILLPRQLLFW